MTEAPEWIAFEAEEFQQPRSVQIGGVHTDVFTSPFDLPLAFRVVPNKQARRLVVEFRYAVDEPHTVEKLNDGVELSIGRASGRLMTVKVPVTEEDSSDSLLAKVLDALRKWELPSPSRRRRHVRSENLRVAGSFVRSHPKAFAFAP